MVKLILTLNLSQYTNISIAGTGDVNVFNLGYDYPINENFKISGGYFIAKFDFEIDENVPLEFPTGTYY